jgi:nucleoside-diphosphate-sugar epimerase
MPTVAITGATGFLGSALTNLFLKKDWNVVSLTRKPSTIKNSRLSFRPYDIEKPLDSHALKNVDYVIHAAYVKQGQNKNALDLNIVGAKNLIAAVKKSGVEHVVFISSMSAHEDAISVYGKQKLAIEKLFAKLPHATVVRPGLIVGNGGIVRDMSQFMKTKHLVPLVDGGKQPLQVIAIDDLAASLYAILDKSLTGRFIVATPEVYTYKSFYRGLANHLKTPVLFVPVPYSLLSAAFKVLQLMHISMDIGGDNLKGLKKLTSMPSAKDMKKIGVVPAGLEESLSRLKG